MGKDVQKHHLTDEQRATAVARVLAGDSRRKVAADFGVSDSTVRQWVKKAESRETAQGQGLAERAQAIAEEIEHYEALARHALIKRVIELAPTADDLAGATHSYTRLTEKALLRQGKPTSITQNVDRMDSEIDRMMREMAERELAGANRNGSG